MKPWYGPAIRLEEKTDVQVIIKDFGTDWEDAARELKEEKQMCIRDSLCTDFG